MLELDADRVGSPPAHYLSVTEAAAAMRRGEFSPIDLVAATLERIEALDGSLKSYVTVARETALDEAAAATAELAGGRDRGPMHGIPVAVKDIFATRGLATTARSALLAGWIPDDDATAIRRLREAGAVLIGKHALHEFAYGAATFDTPFPPARNPWDVRHVPGGSSSGSAAAVAAGLCFAALGSDTGGSNRKPAALCGVVGLKPTFGRVSRHGMLPLSRSLDHVGLITRSVEDCAVLLAAIAGPDERDDATAGSPPLDEGATLRDGIEGVRLGIAQAWLDDQGGADPQVAAAFRTALAELERGGARLVEIDHRAFVAARDVNTVIIAAEAYAYHEQTLRSNPAAYGRNLRTRLLEGAFLSAADYIHAQAARRRLSEQIGACLDDVDAILSPTTPLLAETFEDVDAASRYKVPSFTSPFNLAGLPAMSVPCGWSSSGLPIGLQIAGRRFDEATVLRIGWWYEQATPWHNRHPEL